MNFQEIVLALHKFWSEQDCLIWEPHNVHLGAGTGNPATFLRVLGPEPWNVGYVEPSIRPDDGRYGDNPNRMQRFYQYQVILKPDPGNPQELYLASLEALGLDIDAHDVRFVEDNWESPALGAWGLGWEVWLDGQEITQFTYFQQAGGINLEPVSVEITYGLERIAIALQDKDAVWDLEWGAGISYAEMLLDSEIEQCTYYFEVAGVEDIRAIYDAYEREYERALDRGLVSAAYDCVLECSHLFNVLDTRGAVGVTERASYFGRMREMSREIAAAYVEQRKSKEYPLLPADAEIGSGMPAPELPPMSAVTESVDFLLEIGAEELPPGDLDDALAQLRADFPALLGDLNLAHEGVSVFGTPRRLAVMVKGLAPRQPDQERVEQGPPARVAFDSDGNPTKAALGFARKYGLDVGDLRRHKDGDREYVVATVKTEGRPTPEVLAEALPDFIAGIRFNKAMRWNASGVAFSRPIRWFVALLGDQPIPFAYAGIGSGRTSRSSRPNHSEALIIKSAGSYLEQVAAEGVVVDPDARRSVIAEQVEALAAEVGGRVPDNPALFDEVANLVEQPFAFRGRFEEKYLDLPREILIAVMRKHQRYFPIEDEAGKLLPYFIAVRNGTESGIDTVRAGNEHVIRARFSDADFFYNADRRQKLEDFLPKLGTLTFQEKLGSVRDKTERLQALVDRAGDVLLPGDDVRQTAKRAALLARADQATQMVVEMTSLEGIMGRYYALHGGETETVADAIFEHYLPRSAGDILPQTQAGVALALLDRIDSLIGLFAVGLEPTGSADPYGLRRAALGVVQILLDRGLDLDLRPLIAVVGEVQPVEVTAEHRESVLNFIAGRLRQYLLDEGHAYDVVDAVLAEQAHNPVGAAAGVVQLGQWVGRGDWENILDSYARCVRITRDKARYEVDPAAFAQQSSRDLYEAAAAAHAEGSDNVDAFLNAFVPVVPAVTAFFDEVLVMDEDEALRNNRLALLQYVAALADGIVDMSRLQGF